MSFIKTFITMTSLLSLMGPTPALGAPTEMIKIGEDGNRVGPFNLINLYPQEPDRSEKPIQAIHLETYNGLSVREQVAVFKGIPAEAKTCKLKWAQAPTPGQVFIAKYGPNTEPGILTRQLSGFPAEGVALSYSSVQPFDNKLQDARTINFENWDNPGTVRTHEAAENFDCMETMYIKLSYKNTTADMHSCMTQDYANGLRMYYAF